MCPLDQSRFVALGAAGLALLCMSELSGQVAATVFPDIPGTYATKRCIDAPFPEQLPALSGVLDSAETVEAMRNAGINERVVFALRAGMLPTVPRVRVLEKKVSDEVAARAAQVLDSLIRPRGNAVWTLRLIVDGRRSLSLSLARSRVCAGSPSEGTRTIATRIVTVPAGELEDLRRNMERSRHQRRAMVHRVLVDVTGRALAVEVASSSGDAQMDYDVAKSLKDMRFTPTKLDDWPVSSWIEIRGDS